MLRFTLLLATIFVLMGCTTVPADEGGAGNCGFVPGPLAGAGAGGAGAGGVAAPGGAGGGAGTTPIGTGGAGAGGAGAGGAGAGGAGAGGAGAGGAGGAGGMGGAGGAGGMGGAGGAGGMAGGMADAACVTGVNTNTMNMAAPACAQCVCTTDPMAHTKCDAMCWALIQCIGSMCAGDSTDTVCIIGMCAASIGGADMAMMFSPTIMGCQAMCM